MSVQLWLIQMVVWYGQCLTRSLSAIVHGVAGHMPALARNGRRMVLRSGQVSRAVAVARGGASASVSLCVTASSVSAVCGLVAQRQWSCMGRGMASAIMWCRCSRVAVMTRVISKRFARHATRSSARRSRRARKGGGYQMFSAPSLDTAALVQFLCGMK